MVGVPIRVSMKSNVCGAVGVRFGLKEIETISKNETSQWCHWHFKLSVSSHTGPSATATAPLPLVLSEKLKKTSFGVYTKP